jgi:hypothetical protein
MNKPFNLNQIASTIADLIKQGIDIRVDVKKDVFDIWHVVVCDPSNSTSVHLHFNVADNEPEQQDNVDVDQSLFGRVTDIKPVALPTVKGVETIAGKKKNSTWWSRYHFEANVMKMTWQSLHDQEPGRVRFSQRSFIKRLADLMQWQSSTAAKHVQRAAKLSILRRSVIGRQYYIESVFTQIHDKAEQQAREQQPAPGSTKPEGECGVISFDKNTSVDETLLP